MTQRRVRSGGLRFGLRFDLAVAVAGVVLGLSASGCNSSPSSPDVDIRALTSTADNLRTGWYPNQPGLDPVIVGGPSFKRIWNQPLPGVMAGGILHGGAANNEQVFAQPLVTASSVFVATEENNVYELDPQTGTVQRSANFGVAFRASDVGCGDLVPSIGITGTPVIDDATNTAYFFSKTYLGDSSITDPSNVGWFMHAIALDTLAERPHFPVTPSAERAIRVAIASSAPCRFPPASSRTGVFHVHTVSLSAGLCPGHFPSQNSTLE